MQTRNLVIVPLALLALLSACGPGRPDAEPARTPEQEEASRRACIAAELARAAEDEVETLEASLPEGEPEDPVERLSQRAKLAALEFGRAYQQHTQLRLGAEAAVDSALNHARTPADSARQMERRTRFATRPPAAGTVEANVRNAYDRRFQELRSDEDHRCNWDL
jgi:hypothetical protein